MTVVLGLFTLNSCDDDNNVTGMLNLSFENLPNLGSDLAYEGWIIVDGSAKTTGVFTVDDNGNLSTSSFDIAADDLAGATRFVLTIEPVPDNDPSPSSLHILEGNFSGTKADLSLDFIADFSDIDAKYILKTPTSAATNDDLSGVWFLDNTGSSPVAGLNLPDLSNNSDWTYEGWVVFDGASGPISTGTFNKVSGADSNGAGSYAGTDAGAPGFPGEDFVSGSNNGITFPKSLEGGKIVISVEPVPDNSAAPFAVKPIVGDVPANASVGTVYTAGKAPAISGTATR